MKIHISKEKLIVGLIFVIAIIAMLAWAIHSVDVYNGTFP
jgi:flagellar biogenesis protein FliO